MHYKFYCVRCKSEHVDPAEARLGYHVLCLACVLDSELERSQMLSAFTKTIDESAAVAA